ncbi:MAG: bifunctional phosphopantothenoylcysteine decarboxylase/phosphopantothenate--cysteine ligase CoaBC [Candidatus Saganbacteria bacterium]|nr:bifunctional phosphopantothenoylcysteine decarboxylase/phosphopantothenate--cysteine ligase CoaBC [Candidatus Saganbacteria bacterium]
MLSGKTIIVGVSSSIAAYKACEVVSRLKKLGADVWVAMTKEAGNLIAPLTFRTLSGNPVITDLFAPELNSLPVPHISLTKKAHLIIISPCTANIIAKLAQGLADDPLTTMVLASEAPKLIAPAMNPAMWRNPLVVENTAKLKRLGFQLIGPESGCLACGDSDIGRMSEPDDIISRAVGLLGGAQDLKGRHVLVTAGGTKEAIDPVRFISNRSSGRMGYALARAARERGADVTLISASGYLPDPLDIKAIKVESAAGMLEAVLDFYNNAQAVIMAAAVADFRPKHPKRSKIKKVERRKLKVEHRIELEPTEDILKAIAQQKGRNSRLLVGFALETEELIRNAKKKLEEKDLDLIVANDQTTLDGEAIKFSLISRDGRIDEYPLQSKDRAAHVILDRVAAAV